jgi:hypothetical protein
MNEPPAYQLESWRERLQRWRSHTRIAALFAVGVFATFIALLM